MRSDRIPPHDDEAEDSVLGALACGRDCDLLPHEFYSSARRLIFLALSELRAEGIPIDGVTLKDKLQQRGWLEDAGGIAAVMRILEAVPFADHVDHYAAIVRHKAGRRRIIDLSNDIAAAAYDGHSMDELDDLVRRLVEPADGNLSTQFVGLTSAELDRARYELKYAVPGIIVKDQPALLSGAKKSLKTGLMIDLTLSLSAGGWFLQKFKVDVPQRVGFMSGESGAATIQETARRIARSKGAELSDFSNAIWEFSLPTFGEPRSETALRRFIERKQLAFCMIDPAYLCMPLGDDAKNLFRVGAMLTGITRIGQDTGATMLICHHTRQHTRTAQFDPPELEDVAWSGFQEWARQWILLGRRERYEPGTGDHRLWMATGGSAGHSGLWGVDVAEGTRDDPDGRRWDVDVMPAADARASAHGDDQRQREAREQKQLADDMDRLRGVVGKFPEGETIRTLREACNLPGGRAGLALNALEDAGEVERVKVQKRNQEYDGFRPVGTGGN